MTFRCRSPEAARQATARRSCRALSRQRVDDPASGLAIGPEHRLHRAGSGRVVTISMSEQTMTRRGFVPYGPSGAAVEALARVIAADLAGTPVTANILLPGGATATGMVPDEIPDGLRANLLDPVIMGPPIVWLASADAAEVHDERIVARDFGEWLAAREKWGPMNVS
jgi:NAD(P)-dependent dehydrogenase (short-subunit alcohol dehydrogenase family)